MEGKMQKTRRLRADNRARVDKGHGKESGRFAPDKTGSTADTIPTPSDIPVPSTPATPEDETLVDTEMYRVYQDKAREAAAQRLEEDWQKRVKSQTGSSSKEDMRRRYSEALSDYDSIAAHTPPQRFPDDAELRGMLEQVKGILPENDARLLEYAYTHKATGRGKALYAMVYESLSMRYAEELSTYLKEPSLLEVTAQENAPKRVGIMETLPGFFTA